MKALAVLTTIFGVFLPLAVSFSPQQTANAANSDLETAIQTTMQGAVTAFNSNDVGTFVSYWTDQGFEQEFGGSKTEAAAELSDEMSSTDIALLSVSEVTPTDTGATAVVELNLGGVIERVRYSYVLDGGRWKIDAREDLPEQIPAGKTVVDVKLQEYAFVYDKSLMASGNVALNVTNAGTEEHELIILKLNSDEPLDQLLLSEDDSAIQFIAAGGPYTPGQQTTLVLADSLQPGRYAFVCFLPAADGTPHAFKGMVSEFNVTGSATGATSGTGVQTGNEGGTISPPNTGDGGLLP